MRTTVQTWCCADGRTARAYIEHSLSRVHKQLAFVDELSGQRCILVCRTVCADLHVYFGVCRHGQLWNIVQ